MLHIVKNYTGDIMNFEMAADLARAEGIEVESVVIDDDVAVKDSLYTAGRRGVGITVLAEKLCGAAAEQRRSLKEVADVCRKVKDWGRSMGMALTSCTVPHVGKPTFDLPEDQMEIGIGIHGEPGRVRMPLKPADEIVEMLMEPIISDIPYKAGDEVLMFVNGMGGTPLIELYIVYRKAYEIAEKHGLKVVRNLIGPYITSLEMAGTSITLLKMDDRHAEAVGCAGQDPRSALGRIDSSLTLARQGDHPIRPGGCQRSLDMSITRDDALNWIKAVAGVIAENSDYLTQLDAAIGDADHGANMDRGFKAVMTKLPEISDKDIGTIFKTVGMTLISTVGGAGGPLYGTFFLQAGMKTAGKMELDLADWTAALEAALSGVIMRGKAEPGDKTMVDALTPAVTALKQAVAENQPINQALRALGGGRPNKAWKATIPLVARKGRASYLGERSAGHQDPAQPPPT